MKTYITPDGFKIQMLSKEEEAKAWKELSVDVSPIGKNIPLYTPKDNLEYFIVSEKELAYDKYEAVLKIQGKKYTAKYNVCNQDAKIYQLVRKVYGK